MKVEVLKESKEITYPCLMIGCDEDLVILFKSKCFGTVVSDKPKGYKVGYYCEEWDYSRFKPFNGTIKLSNK